MMTLYVVDRLGGPLKGWFNLLRHMNHRSGHFCVGCRMADPWNANIPFNVLQPPTLSEIIFNNYILNYYPTFISISRKIIVRSTEINAERRAMTSELRKHKNRPCSEEKG